MTDQGIKSAATRAEYARVNGWMAGKGKLGVYPSPRDIHAVCSDGRWIRIVWFGPPWNPVLPLGKYQNFGWSRWLWLGPQEITSIAKLKEEISNLKRRQDEH